MVRCGRLEELSRMSRWGQQEVSGRTQITDSLRENVLLSEGDPETETYLPH